MNERNALYQSMLRANMHLSQFGMELAESVIQQTLIGAIEDGKITREDAEWIFNKLKG